MYIYIYIYIYMYIIYIYIYIYIYICFFAAMIKSRYPSWDKAPKSAKKNRANCNKK